MMNYESLIIHNSSLIIHNSSLIIHNSSFNLHFSRKASTPAQYAISIGVILLVAMSCYLSTGWLGYKTVALILLMTVSLIAMVFDILPVLLSALLSALIWNYFFIPPVFTFHINNTEDMLMFLLYFIIASVNAVLTFKIRKEEKKARDKEEKEKTIRLYNTVLNSLSHELRTPVATIVGAIDTLKENKDKLSIYHQNELLSQIDTASFRLNRQVENLLNMSRLETGTLKLKLDWCDVNELIYGIIPNLDDSDNHTMVFVSDEMLPFFKLDRGLIEQVMQNLVHNAIQYTPEGTEITIRVSHHENQCEITISDNGPGMSASELAHIFDKFYRGHNARTGGVGLGLSIVKGFVEAHNGSIEVSTPPQGHGTSFTVRIPAEANYLNQLKNE